MKASEIVGKIEKYREIILTNLIMIAETPAPMEEPSEKRAKVIQDRLSEYNLSNLSMDEVKNVTGMIPSKKDTRKNIVLVAHLDTVHKEKIDHTVRMETDTVIGAGIVDNSLGVAMLMSLPYILEDMGLEFDSNIILLFAGSSLGASDLKGTRFFLDHFLGKIDYGVCVEGNPLGRISYQSLGSTRQKITMRLPEEYDWSHFGTANAIVELNRLMNAILEIPLPSRPKTSIVFNRIRGGKFSSQGTAHDAFLNIDVRSESNDLVEKINTQIQGLVQETFSTSGIDVEWEIISRRRFGGLFFSHPMVQALKNILTELELPYRVSPSVADLSAFIDKQIPAVTLGLTTCEQLNNEKEIMHIKPLYKGGAQLLSFLIKLDEGITHD